MTDVHDFIQAAGWEDREVFVFQDEEGGEEALGPCSFDGGVMLYVHAGKAFAVGFGFTPDGPILRIRAFDGEEEAAVDSIGFANQITLNVGARAGREEHWL